MKRLTLASSRLISRLRANEGAICGSGSAPGGASSLVRHGYAKLAWSKSRRTWCLVTKKTKKSRRAR